MLTYGEVGATAGPDLPDGYRGFEVARRVGTGEPTFREAVRRLRSWEVHRRAGLRVDSDEPVHTGQRLTLGLSIGPVRIEAPVQIVYTVDRPYEWGFAYGTLPGHPEIGEERFAVLIDDDDRVWARIRAFSRPARWHIRAAGPAARLVQDLVTRRYLSAFGD